MRLAAIVAAIFSIAALVLSLLCLFAGSKPNFMESFDVITLNTSRIGQNLLNSSEAKPFEGSNPLTSLINNASQDVASDLSEDLNSGVRSVAKDLGLQDFYSMHLMTYCHGFFKPVAVPNNTLSKGDISKNITGCSNRTAMFHFNPTDALEQSLNNSGVGVTLDDLNWPDAIEDGLKALRVAEAAAFVLYCIGIAFTLLALLISLIGILSPGKILGLLDIILAFLAFLSLGIASAIMTAVAVKGSHTINKYGKEIGVSANKGTNFMIFTWVATGLMFVTSMIACGMCFGNRRRVRTEKHPY